MYVRMHNNSMQLCVTHLVKMECASQMTLAAVQKATQVKNVMKPLLVNAQRTSVRMGGHAPALLRPPSAHALNTTLVCCVKSQVSALMLYIP